MPRTTCSLLAGLLLSAGVVLAMPAAADSVHPSADLPIVPLRPLTLNAALALAGANNPELAAARAAVAASAADAAQAARFANPELALEVENFAGRDGLQGFAGAESTLRLEQPLEIGGQRGRRRAVGEAAHAVALRQQHLAQAEIQVQVVTAFMALLAAQQELLLAEEQLQLTRQLAESIQVMIDSGKSPQVDALRFQPLLVDVRLSRERAALAVTVARRELAAVIGLDSADGLEAQGELARLPELPAEAMLQAVPEQAPRLAAARALREQAAAELAGERRQAIPDLALGFGVRRFEESGDTALVAGISLSLPLFDWNRDGIDAAQARLVQARQFERGSRLRMDADLAQADAELRRQLTEARALQDELLPAARQALDAIDFGYRAGKFGLLELLDARKQLAALRARLVSAQAACHVAAARHASLLGQALPVSAPH